MGRSYLGENIWAADVMLPSPSALRSSAKETTLKASIVYSGRQHANEVSSTSHILKLGEQLVTDPDNARPAQEGERGAASHHQSRMARSSPCDLAKITPDNMLHPGYHGALSADVSDRPGRDRSGLSRVAHAPPVDRSVAARCVSESARLSVARMGAAVFRIHRLGAKPAGRQSRTRLVDSARLVHQPELPARRDASLQHEDRLRNSGSHRGSRAQRARPAPL